MVLTGNTVLEAILSVFEAVGAWFADFVPTMTRLFWEPLESGGGQLTFLGVLAIAGLSISVVLLVVSLIQNFLHFRG